MNNPHSSIPGPRGNFLMGNLLDLRRGRLKYLFKVAETYRDIARLGFGPIKAVLVFHPDGVQHVLQDNHSNYSKETRAFSSLKKTLGNGLLVSNGDFWLRQRRLIQPAFHRQEINNYAEMMVIETLAMLDGWSKSTQDGKGFDLQKELMRLTLAIVTQALFGSKVTDPDGRIGADIAILIADPTYQFDHLFFPPDWVPTRHNRQLHAARKDLNRLINEIISGRHGYETEFKDLLSRLMLVKDETGQGMSDRQVRDEVITLFLAGHETTAVALSWTVYLLSQHPEAEQRLVHELGEVLGGRTPTIDDLPRLVYTRMVFNESLRLYPPAWFTERMALKDDEILGYSVPAGTTVIVSPLVTHRHPEFWPDPETFIPERFNAENSSGRPRYAYFPFGGGPRQCIGSNFALLEAQLILATVLQRYHLELEPGQEVVPEPLVTLRPKGGLWMRIEER